jgi:hypothetical protein
MIFGATFMLSIWTGSQRILNKKSKVVLDIEFHLNLMKVEIFDWILRITTTIRV